MPIWLHLMLLELIHIEVVAVFAVNDAVGTQMHECIKVVHRIVRQTLYYL